MSIDNLLGINDSLALSLEEERLSKLRAAEIFDLSLLDGHTPGSFETLSFIHHQLFQDVYAFAGRVRNVDISKGSFRFASHRYLSEAIAAVEAMPQDTFDCIIEKYVEMNVIHPFREGNGRSGRIWLDHMLKAELGLAIDWSKVDKRGYLLAMERSPVMDTEIKDILRKALIKDDGDRKTFIKGIDISYAYEGYSAYPTESLCDKGLGTIIRESELTKNESRNPHNAMSRGEERSIV